MNELIMICILIIGILSLYLANKILDTFGIKIIFVTYSFISFILSFKYLTLSTFQINASILTYCVVFTSISFLLEKNKTKEANQLINLNLVLNVFSSLLLYIMAQYVQSINDTIGINMTNVFTNNFRVLIITPISIYISLRLLVIMYNKIKGLYNNIFISMISTYLAIGLIDLIITKFISYFRILSIQDIIKILLSTYMVELIIIVIYSLLFTLYTSKKVKK